MTLKASFAGDLSPTRLRPAVSSCRISMIDLMSLRLQNEVGRPGLLSRLGDGRLLRILGYDDERAVGGLRVNGIGVVG
jgi:hypothetical protein